MELISKIPITAKIAATKYGTKWNPNLARLILTIEEYEHRATDQQENSELLLEMMQHADFALSDMQTRLQGCTRTRTYGSFSRHVSKIVLRTCVERHREKSETI